MLMPDEMLLPPPLLHIDSSSPYSPPSCFRDTSLYLDSHFDHHQPSLSTDPWFADRDEKFSCLDGRNLPLGKYVNAPAGVPAIYRLGNCGSLNCWDESSRSLEGSSISEQFPRKRKSLDRGKANEPSKFAEGGDDSVITATKRSREDEGVDGGDDVGLAKQPKLGNEAEEGVGGGGGGGRKKNKNKKGGEGDDVEPPKDYIHVRARRGQATDSHSLAERVRREKISERMKMLQDLVPSCSKVTGKALMLDEIINYVQSLQRQVEFLSMKLASVNTDMHTRIISKDMFQSSNNNTITAAQLSMFEPPLHDKMQPFQGEDLHSIVEMGLFGQTNPWDFDGQGQMNNSMNI